MRIAYVCRDLATDGGSEVFADARAAAHAGHEVYLISDALPVARSRVLLRGGEPRWVRVERSRPDHRYFGESHGYADRVHDTLRRLPRLDLAEICGGEGLAVLRAKRLGGEFAGTKIVVRPAPAIPRPATLDDMIAEFAAGYCLEHAGVENHEPDQADDLVSVIVPVFDHGRYLRQAIESVRGYPHLEIIVVDDGSADPETVRIVDELDGVTKIHLPRSGLPAARNAGLAEANGTYIVPLDADDLLPPEFIAAAVNALRRNPDLGYVTGRLRYFGLLEHTHVPVGHVPDLSLIINTFGRATGLFRRDILDKVGGYDESLPAYEDWDLHIRLAKAGCESDVLPIDGQYYRRHANSMSFGTGEDTRLALHQQLLHTHAGPGTAERLLPLLLRFWKTRYEPSASVQLQRGHA